jgi:hypothetical protein
MGEATAWNPDADGTVYSIASSGDAIYAGGFFSNIGGTSSDGAVALNISSGSAVNWNPGLNSGVMSIGLSYYNQRVYLGGDFTEVGGASQSYFGSVANTGDQALMNPPVFEAGAKKLTFGTVPSNRGFSDSLVVRNTGGGSLTISAVISSDSAFSASPGAAEIAPGDSMKFTIYLRRNSPGDHYGTLYFLHDGAEPFDTVAFEASVLLGVSTGARVPLTFSLEQNYPNPFNPATNIGFRIADAGFVTLKVYDVLGERVVTLVSKVEQPGNYQVEFNGSSLASGVYFYRISVRPLNQTGMKYTKTMKLMLLK